jgi:hypothetical protein
MLLLGWEIRQGAARTVRNFANAQRNKELLMWFVYRSSFFVIALGLGVVSCLPSGTAGVQSRARDLGPVNEALHRSTNVESVVSETSSLRLLVKGIRPMPSASQLCYSVDDSNAISKTTNSKSNVTCAKLSAGQTAFEIRHTNVPKPAYIFVFHDENANSKLDFTVLNLLVERREAIGEGYAFVEDPSSTSADPKIRRIVILPNGENRLETSLVYERTAFVQFLEEKAWEQIINKARESDEKNTTRNADRADTTFFK